MATNISLFMSSLVFMRFLTTQENLARVVMNVLQHLNLTISGLCGQAYDGAANIADRYTGAQAIIRKTQALAPFVHCVNHIIKQACAALPVIHNSLEEEVRAVFWQSEGCRFDPPQLLLTSWLVPCMAANRCWCANG